MEKKQTNTITNEPVNNSCKFYNEFFFHETGYFQLALIDGKLIFTQRTLNQIYDILGISDNEKEKENCRLGLHANRKVDISNIKVNYVYTVNPPDKDYILNLKANKIDVFVTTNLSNEIQDNDLWENYLSDRFGVHKGFAKNWISAYIFLPEYLYMNNLENKRLPIMMLLGDRSVGKTSFISLISKIYGVNEYAKITKEIFVSRFNGWKKCKLVHINESSKLGKDQYEKIKGIMGSSVIEIEKKGKEMITITNNISMIIDSNERNPIYTKFAEIPNDTSENQFFVTTFPKLKTKSDRQLQLLEKSFLNYIKTELRAVFGNEVVPQMDSNTWIIETPITTELTQMFMINKTNFEHQLEEIVSILKTEYLDSNITFISNSSLIDIANRVNAKNVNYLKNDLGEEGVIYPKSEQKRVNGKNQRGYFINIDTVKTLFDIYNNGNVTPIFENTFDEFFDNSKERDSDNIFPLAK